MKARTLISGFLLALLLWAPALHSGFADETAVEGQLPATLEGTFEKKISVNFQNLDAKNALGLLSEVAGLPIVVGTNVSGNLTYTATDLPVREVFDELTEKNGLVYTVENGTVVVKSATSEDPADSGSVHSIPLKYANGLEIMPKVRSFLGKGDKVIFDDTSNSLIFVGSSEDYERLSQVVALFDEDPKQILIQGLIIETTETFLQSLGFSYGSSSSALVSTTGPTNANLALAAGTVWGTNLNLSVQAAESRGDAKVISRPKVVTLNNKPAMLNSGLTLSVQTLSGVATAQPGQVPVALAGGLSTVNAGLTVTITPTIVGDGRVRLLLNINDSSPDASASVDGIPGVDTNSATTTVIVDDNRTAIIAGLIKQTKSSTSDGVPFFMDLPILGALFRSVNKSNENDELAIFVTPSILKSADPNFYTNNVPSPKRLLDSVGDGKVDRPDSQAIGAPLPAAAPAPAPVPAPVPAAAKPSAADQILGSPIPSKPVTAN